MRGARAPTTVEGLDDLHPPEREPEKPRRLLTLQQVADYLQLSTKTVRRLRIPCLRIGRAIRFRPSDVERFLAARRFHA